jgi:ribosomal protein S18 acetylase RimI-like enzyme
MSVISKQSDFAIRAATLADIPQLCELLKELFTIESDFAPSQEKQLRGLELLLTPSSGSSLVLVAVQAANVLGMCSVQVVVSTAEGGSSGILEDLIVHPEHRGRGVGGSLISTAAAWCTGKGITRLQLLADKSNAPALRFYFSRGWNGTDLICLRKRL